MARELQLFLDLDGTLTDSAVGICGCIQHALAGLGERKPAADEIRPLIGSPLRGIFEAFLFGGPASNAAAPIALRDRAALVERAVVLFRERFDTTGFAENQLYPGVREGLEHLRARGHTLYIATAKQPADALRVARHFAFDSLFAAVFGAENDAERNDKALLLARALKSSGALAPDSVMIGDRSHDMRAACRNGATPLGAGWGYGTAEELNQAGAIHIASSPAEMVQWIDQHSAAAGSSP